MGFFNKNNKDKKVIEEQTIGSVIDDNLDKLNQAFDDRSDELLTGFAQDFEKISQNLNSTAPQLITDDIDEVLNNYVDAQERSFNSSASGENLLQARADFDFAATQLKLFLQTHDKSKALAHFANDIAKQNIVETEFELIEEENPQVISNCRAGMYLDRISNGMYMSGKDRHQIELSLLSTDYTNVHEDDLKRNIRKLVAIENAVFIPPERKRENVVRQIGFIENMLKFNGGSKLVSNITQKNLDEGYWVQTELDILTLPSEEKQAIRTFRDQNKNDGIYFEPGTILEQYTASTGMSFEDGFKK